MIYIYKTRFSKESKEQGFISLICISKTNSKNKKKYISTLVQEKLNRKYRYC